MRTRSRSVSGDINLTSIFIYLALLIGGWCLVEYSIALFGKTKVEGTFVQTILQNKNEMSDEALAEKLVEGAKSVDPTILIDAKDVQILRSADGARIEVKSKLVWPVKIPLISKSWDLHFDLSASEKLR